MHNPFLKPIKRKGIMTLSDGSKFRVDFDITPKRWYTNEDYERELVDEINKSQTKMVNKVVKIHLMRN